MFAFSTLLLQWFDQYGRKNLPWQQNKTPYRVWVSEIMLQQTQVATVIPYFEKFMKKFPDLAALAKAPIDDVLHLWAGLGYYSRARNLHKAAQMVMDKFAGEFPSALHDLQSLPGIGQSTAGAIAAIAFQQQATILDGNVKRVLARVYAVMEAVNDKSGEEKLWKFAKQNTPSDRVADYTQAIMDLGATLCTRSKPNCVACPFNKNCLAFEKNLVHELPAKKKTKKIPTKQAAFLVLQKNDAIMLQKRPPTGIWGGLWSLPEITGLPDHQAISDFCQKKFGLKCSRLDTLPAFRHTFSHYHLEIYPVLLTIASHRMSKIMDDQEQIWYNLRQPAEVGLPQPVQKILQGLISKCA